MFLPSNIPDDLVYKLYNAFALRHSSKEMTFEDFLETYYLLSSDSIMPVVKPTGTALLLNRMRKRSVLYFYIFKETDKDGTLGEDEESFSAAQFYQVGMLYFDLTS